MRVPRRITWKAAQLRYTPADSFHSGVIEIIVKKGARFRYSTIQNWSNNMYNLVTQRAIVHENATMEWVDANLGSKLTMKYPSCYLVGKGAHGEILSLAFASAANTRILAVKWCTSLRTPAARSLPSRSPRAEGALSYAAYSRSIRVRIMCDQIAVCDALLLDETSRSDTYP